MHIHDPVLSCFKRAPARRTMAEMLSHMRPIMGGDGSDEHVGTELAEALAKLPELSDEDLQSLETSLVEAFDEADGETPKVEAMEAIAAEIDKVRAEGEKRVEAAKEADSKAAEIRGKVHTEPEETPKAEEDSGKEEDETPKAEETPPEEEPEETPKETPEPETPEPEETPKETPKATETPKAEETPKVEEPIAAAAPRPSLATIMANRPRSRAPKASAEPSANIVAAGDVANISVGQRFSDMRQFGQAVYDKGRAALQSGRPGRFSIAHATWDYPEERRVRDGDPMSRIQAVTAGAGEIEAMVAAGGLCAPVEVRYDLYTLGDARRPIRDALVRFDAGRGGIQFNAPPQLSDVGAGVNIYTEAADTDSVGYPKGFYTIDCGSLVTAEVAAVVARGRIGNFQKRFNPESWDANWGLILTQHARVAENALWDSIVTDSTAITTGVDAATELGTARRVLRAIGLYIEGVRSRHRIPDNFGIRVLAPEWLRANIREDLAAQAPGDDAVAVADAAIAAYFAARGAMVTWSPDAGAQVFGNQAAGALNPWPDTVEVLIFPEGAHLFLDGGELNFGLEIRDSTLNNTNDVEAMTETFEETAHIGPESVALTVDVCASGRTSEPIAYDPCTTGS